MFRRALEFCSISRSEIEKLGQTFDLQTIILAQNNISVNNDINVAVDAPCFTTKKS